MLTPYKLQGEQKQLLGPGPISSDLICLINFLFWFLLVLLLYILIHTYCVKVFFETDELVDNMVPT